MSTILSIGQVGTSIILIALILLQERESGVSAIFGGGEGEFYRHRRGVEKLLFTGTLVLMALFIALALLNLVL